MTALLERPQWVSVPAAAMAPPGMQLDTHISGGVNKSKLRVGGGALGTKSFLFKNVVANSQFFKK